jgi:peroxiredoxin
MAAPRAEYTFTPPMLDSGQPAPDLKLPSSGGEDVQLSDAFARHRATILAFYVLDFTPG